MIAEEGFDRDLSPESFVSDEEMRELLKEFPTRETCEEEAHPRVLFVSRRGADAAILEERLVAAGASVQFVRNPFSALDQLRKSPPEAVVTDLDLWAEDGDLLLDRLRQTPKGIPVLFLSAEREDCALIDARLRKAGAWRVLFLPIEAGLAENAARGLVEAVGGRVEEPSSDAIQQEMIEVHATPTPSNEDPERERSALLDLDDGANPGLPPECRVPAEAELSWLRFYLHVGRSVRAAASREDLATRILDGARVHLGAHGAGVFFEDSGRRIARMEASPGSQEDAMTSLLLAASLHSTTDSHPSITLSDEGEAGGSLVLRFGDRAPATFFVLVGLSRGVRLAASSCAEDIRLLLRERFLRGP